jgi:hypothetical protein
MYKLLPQIQTPIGLINSSMFQKENIFVPFDVDNTDYQQFKKDLVDGVALNDAEGNAMTADQITSFLGTLA